MNSLLLGDWRFFWPENLKFIAHLPLAWDSSLNTGIGISQVNTLWITSYLNFTSFFSFLGFSWDAIGIIFWLLPAIMIGFFSSFWFYKKNIDSRNLYSILAGLIFVTNTYFISIYGGGQIGVAFAYTLMPLILHFLFKLINKTNLNNSVFAGLLFSIQILFDPRLAELTLFITVLYYLLRFKFEKKDILYLGLVPLLIIFCLHSFWILPLIFYKTNLIPQGFDSISGLKFLSFATLENSLSLLHPNWPDNIFGKVSFMRAEFLLIPILAYSSLLFINKVKNKTLTEVNFFILFFAFIGIIGSFLAKGANNPFGEIYIWLFQYIPGFSPFRDSTKFYTLVAFSYSILIPYAIFRISNSINKKDLRIIVFFLFLIYWLYSLREVNFKHFENHKVPQDYISLKNFIVNEHKFFRTLWIPTWQRYGYFSDLNPAIGRGELFKEASASGMIKELENEKSIRSLQELGVKYVVVPEDSEGEIFLNDRKYDEKIYKKTILSVEKVQGLIKTKEFGKIILFEVPNSYDRFWINKKSNSISYKMIDATKYKVIVKDVKKSDVAVFSEGFSPYWVAKNSDFEVKSALFHNKLNSFVLPKDGTYSFEVYYEPQKLINVGLIISGTTLLLIIVYLVKINYKKKA